MKMILKCFFIFCAFVCTSLLVLFVAELWQNGWSFDAKSSDNYEQREVIIDESFSSLIIGLKSDKLTILPSEGGECRLVTFEKKTRPHTLEVRDGALVLSYREEKSLYDYIRVFSFAKTYATLYIPAGHYDALAVALTTGDVTVDKGLMFGSVSIAATTGNVEFSADALTDLSVTLSTGNLLISTPRTGAVSIKGTTADVTITDSTITSLDLSLATGDTKITDTTILADAKLKSTTGKSSLTRTTARNLFIDKSTGSTTLDGVYTDELMRIDATTSRITLNGIDAGEISIKTTSGSVSGSILSEKQFLVRSTSGSISLPDSTSGGICRIETTSGSVKLMIGS